MRPEERVRRTRASMDSGAVEEVLTSPRDSVPPAPADLDTDELAFESEAYRYVAEWLARTAAPANKAAQPFLFLRSRSIPTDVASLMEAEIASTPYNHFRSQTLLQVEGAIIITTVNFEDAAVISVPGAATAQDLFNRLNELGLGGRHTATFEPPTGNLIAARQGLSGTSHSQKVLVAGSVAPWTYEQLEQEVTQFHNDHTRTPEGVLVPWANAKQGLTGEKLELRISKALAYQLDKPVQRGSVLAEVGSASGRMDIYISQHAMVAGAGPCVIEVKVLRSRNSANFSEWWAKKGVIQASLYRDDKAAKCAYLCSFDAREKHGPIAAVDKLAKKKKVEHRMYPMHRSTGSLHETELEAERSS